MSTVNDFRAMQRSSRSQRRAGWLMFVAAILLLFAVSACGRDETSGNGASAVTLTGTSWALASVSIAGKDVAAVASATMDFDADGKTLAGSTGCNQFSGTFKQTGSDLTITLGPTTLAGCVDPRATAQEAAVLAQLPKVASFSSDKQLVLKDSSGTTLLSYDKGLSSLTGTSWKTTGVNNGHGGVESTALTENVTAEFGDNGALSGFAGCNNYSATYAMSGNASLSITKLTSTKKACADDAMTLENQYVTALDKVATYTISGDTLALRDSNGSTQVTYSLVS